MSDTAFWNSSRPIPLQAKEYDVMNNFRAKQLEKQQIKRRLYQWNRSCITNGTKNGTQLKV